LTCASLNVSWPIENKRENDKYQETIKLHQLPHTHIFLGLDGCFPLNPFPAVPDSPVVPQRDKGIPPTPATMVMIPRRSAWLLALLLSAGISVSHEFSADWLDSKRNYGTG